jgi:hypothetical protein
VVARGPMRLMAFGVFMVSLGMMVTIGCLWAWSGLLDAPPVSRIWLLGGAALACFVGGVSTLVAFGMVRS